MICGAFSPSNTVYYAIKNISVNQYVYVYIYIYVYFFLLYEYIGWNKYIMNVYMNIMALKKNIYIYLGE